MKKLKLKLQNIEGAEMLTREQLKTVMGGSENACPSGKFWCRCSSGSSGTLFCASSIQECWDAC